MKYKVEITETLKKVVEVEAENPTEAKEIAKENYYNAAEGYILDSADYCEQTDFWVRL